MRFVLENTQFYDSARQSELELSKTYKRFSRATFSPAFSSSGRRPFVSVHISNSNLPPNPGDLVERSVKKGTNEEASAAVRILALATVQLGPDMNTMKLIQLLRVIS